MDGVTAICLVFPSLGVSAEVSLVIRWQSSELVFPVSSSRTNLLFLSVSLLFPSTLTAICSWGLTSITTPVLSHLVLYGHRSPDWQIFKILGVSGQLLAFNQSAEAAYL